MCLCIFLGGPKSVRQCHKLLTIEFYCYMISMSNKIWRIHYVKNQYWSQEYLELRCGCSYNILILSPPSIFVEFLLASTRVKGTMVCLICSTETIRPIINPQLRLCSLMYVLVYVTGLLPVALPFITAHREDLLQTAGVWLWTWAWSASNHVIKCQRYLRPFHPDITHLSGSNSSDLLLQH